MRKKTKKLKIKTIKKVPLRRRGGRRRRTGWSFRNTLIQIIAGLIIAVGLLLSYAVWINSPIQEQSSISVANGSSVSKISAQLASENLINNEWLFKTSVMLWGGKIKTGLYDLPAGRSVWGIARDLTRGRVAMASITIPEGLSVKQIYEIVGHDKNMTGDLRILYHDGELFPDTYKFPRGEDRNRVLFAMAEKMGQIKKQYENDLPVGIKDWNELLSLAAIIQKETSIIAEMPRVSGVYMNRLKRGMRLQADPTVVYAITNGFGHMQGRSISRRHLQFDSPYNTYRYKGLPPTPIANPGLDAIKAALKPEKHNFYYFVADGSGGHIFAETHEEHQVNHANWRIIRNEKNKK